MVLEAEAMSETPMGPMEQAVDDYYLGGGNVAWSKLCGAAREADARQQRLVDALRRYMAYVECKDDLYAEFGPPEFEDSSISYEGWLDRVLRNPAREALKSVEGEAVR